MGIYPDNGCQSTSTLHSFQFQALRLIRQNFSSSSSSSNGAQNLNSNPLETPYITFSNHCNIRKMIKEYQVYKE
jgi:hypothetical protein